MRQVRVSRKIRGPNSTERGVPLATWVLEEFTAVFHDFALDTDVSRGGFETFPVCVLEKDDGSIILAHVLHVTFLNPQPFETCENKS